MDQNLKGADNTQPSRGMPVLKREDRKFLIGLARAFAGAVLFAISLFMTMEMWWLGFYMHAFVYSVNFRGQEEIPEMLSYRLTRRAGAR
jgi:hypothetical protein